jgi:CHASE2 domain-containing sensor protein
MIAAPFRAIAGSKWRDYDRIMKRRVMFWGLLASVACALSVGLGWFDPLERWAYDVRARQCQFFMPAPDDRVVHLDIDDGTLNSVGHWPMERSVMVAAIGELDRAGAAVIGMDILFDLPAPTRSQQRKDGTWEEVDGDAQLEAAIRASGKVVLASDGRILPKLASAAAGVGDARIVLSEDGTVRQICAVEGGGVKRAQAKLDLAMRMACFALHVQADGVVVERDGVRLRLPGGGDRFVPLTWNARGEGLMQAPVFGTRDWFTAYDVPAHKTSARHVPVIKAYEPIECERSIAMNNCEAERVIGPLADPVGIASSKAPTTQPSDWPAYRSRIERFLKAAEPLTQALKDLGREIDPEQRKILDALQGLRLILQVNDTLMQRRDRLRAWLKGQFNGRVVLVGAMATGMSDDVPTSLHRACPAVVVRGMTLNGILSGELWRCMPRWVDMLATFAAGLLMTWVAASARVVWTVLLAPLISASYAVVNGVVVFDWGNVILSAMGPIVAIAVVTVVALTIRAAAGDAVERRVGAAEL